MAAKKADAVLKSIVSFIKDREVKKEEKIKLWNVLCALRGPDGEVEDKNGDIFSQDEAKELTTNVIRYALFGKTVIAGTSIRANKDERYGVEDRVRMRGHFAWHAHKAFDALGLDWKEKEEETTEEC